MFIGYSDYPARDHTEFIDESDGTAIVCPQCQTGHLVQRRFRRGKTFYFCGRYSRFQLVINFKSLAGECPECYYPLPIEEKIARGVKRLCVSKQRRKPASAE